MLKASDDEIREFFATTIFEGVFSKEIKSNHSDYFKGHIHSIKIKSSLKPNTKNLPNCSRLP